MAAVILFTVVIREGALPKLLEVMLIVFFGGTYERTRDITDERAAGTSNLVCFVIFPMSATSRLQDSIAKSLSSFSTLLDLLKSTFLLEKTVVKDSHTSLADAVQSHAKAFKTLQKDLGEAKNERLLDSRIRGRKLDLYDAAIGSLTRLAQHLAGLRGSTRLQESLIRAQKEGRIDLELTHLENRSAVPESTVALSDGSPASIPAQDTDITASIRLFLQFRDIAGNSMDDLVVSRTKFDLADNQSRCDDALDAVQLTSQQRSSEVDLAEIRNTLASSLTLFTQSSSRAIKRLYAGPRRERGVYEDSDSDSDDRESSRELDDVSSGPNETVFLIYLCVERFEGRADLHKFPIHLGRIRSRNAFLARHGNRSMYSQRSARPRAHSSQISDAETSSIWEHLFSRWRSRREKEKAQYVYKQFRSWLLWLRRVWTEIHLVQVVPVDPSDLQPPFWRKGEEHASKARPDTTETVMSPWAQIERAFWYLGSKLRQPDIRYALKTGLGGGERIDSSFD